MIKEIILLILKRLFRYFGLSSMFLRLIFFFFLRVLNFILNFLFLVSLWRRFMRRILNGLVFFFMFIWMVFFILVMFLLLVRLSLLLVLRGCVERGFYFLLDIMLLVCLLRWVFWLFSIGFFMDIFNVCI